MESVRILGYFNLEEILYAIMQTNGTLTVLPRAPFAPLNANNAKIEVEPASLPVILISEGKFVNENIILAKISKDFVYKQIRESGFEPNQIIFLSINSDGKMYIQPKNGCFKVTQTSFKGGSW